MRSFLELVPHDVLQHIALVGASPGSAPPVDLCCLLATCRMIYDGLNIHSNPHLYAAIFKLKYEVATACSQHTDSSLASELVHRCRALRRCRHLDMSLQGLRQDLWTLLRMVVEEGRCVPLFEARFPKFIVELARYYLGEDVRSQGDIKSLVIWLFCLGVSRQDIFSQNPDVRSTLVTLLRPFVSTSTSRVPPFTSLPPSSTVVLHPASQDWPVALAGPHVGYGNPEEEVLMRYNVRMCSPHIPPPSDAAIILIFALKEAVPLQIPYHLPATRAIAVAENRSGPTAEDYAAFQHAVTLFFSDIRTAMAPQSSATTLNFIKTDPWISEILEVPYFSTRHVRPAYLAGSLTGFWEGSMMISCISLGDPAPKTSSPPDFLCRTPMQCQFSEYYGFPSCTPLPLELDGELQSVIEFLPENFAYHKLTPRADFQHEFACSQLDHVVIGQTPEDHENVWGSGFNFTGRVHDDGLIVFTRRPKNDESEMSETWIFEGRLRYGTAFVGTFRSSSDGSCGVHGIFSMSKRTAVPIQ
ncbi:hypothetical protein B0H13DRAFT_1943131 [Mycena leptocephala]|nr:hypothetical protein B0H13DRAFT_1943131 [Mycena leptocephala]